MAATTGTFEQIVAIEPRHAHLLCAVRERVRELHPGVVEVARPGDRAVSWGWGPKKMSEAYVFAQPYKHHVNLGFYRGAILPDPQGRLQGSGKALRHVSLTRIEQLDDLAVRALLLAARDERREALGQGT